MGFTVLLIGWKRAKFRRRGNSPVMKRTFDGSGWQKVVSLKALKDKGLIKNAGVPYIQLFATRYS
jgi:hypothetical protein